MTDCCCRILSVFFFIFCCPKFKLLLQFLMIVTISRLKMLYFEPFGVFYRDFILLTCILRQPVRLVGLVALFSSGAEFSLWAVSVTDPEMCFFFFFFCMNFLLHSSFTTGCVGRTYFTLSLSVGMGDDHRSVNCNDQYDKLCWSYCYLFLYYLLLAVLVFYSVFVTISTISCVGRTVVYLSIVYF